MGGWARAKKDSQPQIDKLKHLIGIELPQDDYQLLKDEDRKLVEEKYRSSKAEIVTLIELFKDKGYHNGAVYLENLPRRIVIEEIQTCKCRNF